MINAHLFTARDIMATKLVTLSPETSIFDAITMLLKNKFSGAPVVEKDGTLCGVLSEKDCMRVLAGGSYDHRDGEELISVAAFMSRHLITIKLDDGIYHIVDTFDKHNVRRLPVVENGRLVGQVSRRDVLRGIKKMEDELMQYYAQPLPVDRRAPRSFFSVTGHEASELGAKLRR
jgi:CBS domain-containing protein